MKFKHLRSSVAGKLPQPADIDVGQIAINFNDGDPFLSIKDSAGAVRRLGGSSVGNTAPGTPTDGALWVDTSVSPPVLKIYDLTNTAWIDASPDATTSIKGIVQLADAAAIAAGTVGRVVDAAQLKANTSPDASETVKGIAEIATTAEVKAGTDDQRIVTPLKLKGFQQQFTIQSATPPTLVTHPNIVSGTIWVDISQSPPVINLWDPAANSGAGGWEELSSGPKPINPGPSDFAANPAFVSGTGTQADPFIITPSTVATAGGTAQSAQQLSLTGLKVGAAINWTDHSVGAGTRFQQTNGLVPASGNVSLRLAYSDTPNSTASTPYTGDLQLGTTYFRWVVTQNVAVAPDVGAVTLADVASGDRFTSVAFPVSATMTEDGIPASAKKLKAYVEGTLKSAVQTSAITSIGTPPGVVGDYCTFDPLALSKAGNVSWTLANGNLDAHDPEDCYGVVPGTVCVSSGKYYWELTFAGGSTGATDYWGIERCDNTAVKRYPGNYENSYWFKSSGHKISGTGSEIAYGSKFVLADKAGVAFDADNGTLTYYKNGTSLGTAFTGIDTSKPWRLVIGNYANAASITTWTLNAGQRPFAYPAPSGFKPLTKPLDKVLTFADNTGLASFAPNDAVTEVGNGDNGTGTVKSVNAAGNTLTLNGSPAGWDVGSAVKGPLKPGGPNVKLYCKLDAAGAVSDLQSADPGFTAWTPAGAGPYTGTVTFPATLPTGNAPDTDLPAGTTITVEVEASNASGTDSAKSNTVTPS